MKYGLLIGCHHGLSGNDIRYIKHHFSNYIKKIKDK